MGSHSKYSDERAQVARKRRFAFALGITVEEFEQIDDTEHPLRLGSARRYEASGGAGAGEGSQLSMLTDDAMSDWSFDYCHERAKFVPLQAKPHLRFCAVCDSHYCICPA